ncbi:hypothetical protein CORT_0A03680 [Candida orthopsilosis Co 90-125]|uniref:Replication factor A protein 3 n=1 Tax=Candida orthopsilosis (strain 90-125) TaxID=1136231 RepID=H8WWD2_CANO9|nr:hypothetical protein CORT_0A03680 [Candida orthopsilosis Co 90-125]CCG20756.1 hypothetical protein CORT_0A03680 [Candida orthopsilosis Co 90-125]
MEATTKRIDATLLQQNQNNLVRIIGKCESYNATSQSAILISNGSIKLDLSSAAAQDSNNGDGSSVLQVNKNYEVIGKVSHNPSDLKVHVYSIVELTDNLNFKAVEKLVHYTYKVPELFYQEA